MSINPPSVPKNSAPAADHILILRIVLVVIFLIVHFAILAMGIRGVIPKSEVREVPGYVPWSEEVLETAASLPIQDGGRIKPFSTYARFKMLTYHGSLTMKVEAGGKVHKIGPTAWLLDSLFRPDLADKLPVFRVDDADILKPFGIETKKRRARLSFSDFEEGGDETKPGNGFGQLMDRGGELLKQAEEKGLDSLTPREKKTRELAVLLSTYAGLRDSLDIVRGGLPPIDLSGLSSSAGESGQSLKVDRPTKISFWLPILDQLIRAVSQINSEDMRVFENELNRQVTFANSGPTWVPPVEKDSEVWPTLGKTVELVLGGKAEDPEEVLATFKAFEEVAAAAELPDQSEFNKKLGELKEMLRKESKARGLDKRLDTEVTYYNKNWFMYGLVYFVAAFLVSAVGWVLGTGRKESIARWIAGGIYLVGTVTVLIGIAHRIYITGRPPVSNLYDTIPFISATAAILLGIAELLTRRGILLPIGAVLSVIGLFFAFRFELGDAKDNMDPLRAVLDSNYWLATHVVTITIGYAGGLVACFMSTVYVYLALSGVMKDSKGFGRFMTRSVYGITCFTLLFSLVGTVLGGIWANDSWGRFWGWDPKENGALLIVIWTLIILHSRLAGWLKSWGIHLLSILGGSVVVFSWWGVNMLEVGLHSYGFIEGAGTVYYFYGATVWAFFVGIAAKYVELGSRSKSA